MGESSHITTNRAGVIDMEQIPDFEIRSMNITLDRYEMFRKICLERRLNLAEREIVMLFHAYHTEVVG